jgi:hypothetical protein
METPVANAAPSVSYAEACFRLKATSANAFSIAVAAASESNMDPPGQDLVYRLYRGGGPPDGLRLRSRAYFTGRRAMLL